MQWAGVVVVVLAVMSMAGECSNSACRQGVERCEGGRCVCVYEAD